MALGEAFQGLGTWFGGCPFGQKWLLLTSSEQFYQGLKVLTKPLCSP